MTGSELIPGIVLGSSSGLASRTTTNSHGMNRKALLLLLCARIGYTPHLNVQH